ncbi:STE/STE20 protein kinase [Hypoxylon sp. FL0543]|nr:STE/STE20 protein kinase [Hypoxylon sp. FL0543]
MPTSPLCVGQVLRGRLGDYIVFKKIQEAVWFAKNHIDEAVVVKSVTGHPRVANERDVLKRFQSQTLHIRPLIDEIQDPAEPTTIVLRHLDDDLLQTSIQKTLNRKEVKYVSRRILEALSVLHENGFVHTDIKPNNIFVNYRNEANEIRFSDVQLGDFGGTYPQESEWAKSGTPIGAPIWNSPEVLMETPWNTATDIWSFGAVLISLIYGGDFNVFRPKDIKFDDENYRAEIIKSQFRYFGPFPAKYREISSEETLTSILYIMHLVPPSNMTPFRLVTEREVTKEDKEFILKIMQMDWRDRPTAKDLLQAEWFLNE